MGQRLNIGTKDAPGIPITQEIYKGFRSSMSETEQKPIQKFTMSQNLHPNLLAL